MQTVQKYLISLILSYKVRNNTALLRCNANQVGTGHNLHSQPKNPVRTKLAAINKKNVCGTAEVIFVIMIIEYHSNIFIIRYTYFVLEIVSQAAFFIWKKTDQGRIRCDVESSEVFHIIDSIQIQIGPN